ncbi:UNVERIFIED_CONTAM: hypothetical protein FKN15_013383 [Acipenser sinensis]
MAMGGGTEIGIGNSSKVRVTKPLPRQVAVDTGLFNDFEPQCSHPALAGYAVAPRPPQPKSVTSEIIDPHTCSPKEYLENYLFPALLPGMEAMLAQAQRECCLEGCQVGKKRDWEAMGEPGSTAACSFKPSPRPPIPLSLLLSDESAAILIQAGWRGYKVRCDPEVQELRQWQKELREESRDIGQRVQEFWANQESRGRRGMLERGKEAGRMGKVRCDPEVQELRQWQKELREESRDIGQRVQEFWANQESRGPKAPSNTPPCTPAWDILREVQVRL